jgi:hypothetical protein
MKTIIKNFEAKHRNGQHFTFTVYFEEEGESITFFDRENNQSEKIETITTIGEQFIYDFREALTGFNLMQFLYDLEPGKTIKICDIEFKNLEEVENMEIEKEFLIIDEEGKEEIITVRYKNGEKIKLFRYLNMDYINKVVNNPKTEEYDSLEEGEKIETDNNLIECFVVREVDSEKCNGWKNWSTWEFALELDSLEENQQYIMENKEEILKNWGIETVDRIYRDCLFREAINTDNIDLERIKEFIKDFNF